MKDRKLMAVIAAILVLMLTLPAFAEEELIKEDETTDITAEETAESEEEEAGVMLISEGEGVLDIDNDGMIICEPAEGWETVSITADRNVDGIKAGCQIPESYIRDAEIIGGTTLSVTFGKVFEDYNDFEASDSQTAIF